MPSRHVSLASGRNIFVWLYFWVAWILLVCLYYPAYSAGFEGDFAGWLHTYKTETFAEIFHRKNYRVKSLYQLTMTELWCFTHLFGKSPWPWFLLQTALHALNATLLMRFLRDFFKGFSIAHSTTWAVLGSLLFLIAFTQAEPIIWKGAFHYLTGVMMILIVLQQALMYVLHQKRSHAFWAVIVFTLSCFSLEIFYLTPLLVGTLYGVLYYSGVIDRVWFRKGILGLGLPLLICFALYYVLYVFTYCKMLAHYNIKSHAWTISYLLPKWRLYPMRILLFEGEGLGTAAFYRVVGYTLLMLSALASLVLFFRFRRIGSKWKALLYLLFGAVISIGIVSPLGYDSTYQIRNGHYAYTASMFLFAALPLLLFALIRNRKVTVVFILLYGIIHVFLARRSALLYREAGQELQHMLHTFPDKTSHRQKVLLAMPATYKGLVMVGADTIDRFAAMHDVFIDTPIRGTFYSISAYNMKSQDDKVHVQVHSRHHLSVSLENPYNQWQYRYFEPFDFENARFKVRFQQGNRRYEWTNKDSTETYDYYYYGSGQWHQVVVQP